MRFYPFAAAFAACLAVAESAHAQLVFEFTKGPGFLEYETTDPGAAAAMYASAESAAAMFSTLFSDPITLKYTLEYSPTPAGVLAFAHSSYTAIPYATVAPAMLGDSTSTYDATAVLSLPMGPSIPHYRNDSFDLIMPEFAPFLDLTPTPNNIMMDVSFCNAKALGLLAPHAGAPGSDATLVVSSSAAFDFDHTDGITADTYDFRGVMLHEIAHAMGFVSGTDTMATLFPSPMVDPETVPMLTVLDLFRYSPLSAMSGARDISLPIPGAEGPPALRYFSIDGGMAFIDAFSTGDGALGFGDGAQGGHWKDDDVFGLLDPFLDDEFNLSLAWETLLDGIDTPADLIALDVIGWTPVPAPSALPLLALGAFTGLRRRR